MEQLSKSIRSFVRLLHDRQHRDSEQCVLVEGKNAVEEAFRASLNCRYLVMDESSRIACAVPSSVQRYSATPKDMDYMSTTKTSYGIVGVFDKPAKSPVIGSILVIDGLQDPGNLGTLIRSAVAFGFQTLICVGEHVDPYSPKVIRSSAGYVFAMNCVESDVAGLHTLFIDKMQVVGTHLSQDAVSLWDTHITAPYALIIGSEGKGISAEIMPLVTKNIHIPMARGTESLNAAIAGSIIMGYFYGR